MTREELKEHCNRQIDNYEKFYKIHPVTLNDMKRYSEHKMVLDMIEKLDKIEQIFKKASYVEDGKVYSYLYNPEKRLEHIQSVLEDNISFVQNQDETDLEDQPWILT